MFAAAALTHSNTRLPGWLERLLQPVVITLDPHLVHHSIVPDEANANFGAVFSFWAASSALSDQPLHRNSFLALPGDRLSYIEDTAHPDVFRIGKGQF